MERIIKLIPSEMEINMDNEQIVKIRLFFRKLYSIMWIVLAAAIFLTYMVFQKFYIDNFICLIVFTLVVLSGLLVNKS